MGITNKNKQLSAWQAGYYISTILLIMLVLGSTFVFTEEMVSTIIELSAKFGMLALAVMFAIKNVGLAHKKGTNLITDILRRQLPMQREQGLIAFNAFALHSLATIVLVLIRQHQYIGSIMYISFTALVPTVLMVYLYVTSFKPIQKRVKKWKKTHTLGWMLFGSVIAHELLLNGHLELTTIIATVLAIGTLLYGLIVNFNNKRSRKQLAVSVIGFAILGVMLAINDPIGQEIQKIGLPAEYHVVQTEKLKSDEL